MPSFRRETHEKITIEERKKKKEKRKEIKEEELKKGETPIETEAERERKIEKVREKIGEITGEKKVEKGKFEELLEFARREKGEEKVEEKVEEKTIERRGVIDFEKVIKKPEGEQEVFEAIEKSGRNSARMLGYINYYLAEYPGLRKILEKCKTPKTDELIKENVIPIWNDELKLERIDPELKDEFSSKLFEELSHLAVGLEQTGHGSLRLNPKGEYGIFRVDTPVVSKTEGYLLELKRNIEKKKNEIRLSIKDEEGLKGVLEDCKEGANLHIGTFGKAALKEKDLIPAIDAFDYTNELENLEIAGTLMEQMEELKKSGRPEDRELVGKSSKRLLEISEKEE